MCTHGQTDRGMNGWLKDRETESNNRQTGDSLLDQLVTESHH